MFIVPKVVSGLSRMPAEKASTIPVLKPVRGWAARTASRCSGESSLKSQAEHVVLHAQGHQPHLGLLVARDLGCRVQGDRLPDGHHALLGQAVALQERAGGVGPVDLEALVLGAVALDEPDVVEHGADVEELGVIVQAELSPWSEAQRKTRREWSKSSCVETSPTNSVASRAIVLSGIGIPAMAGLRITLMRSAWKDPRARAIRTRTRPIGSAIARRLWPRGLQPRERPAAHEAHHRRGCWRAFVLPERDPRDHVRGRGRDRGEQKDDAESEWGAAVGEERERHAERRTDGGRDARPAPGFRRVRSGELGARSACSSEPSSSAASSKRPRTTMPNSSTSDGIRIAAPTASETSNATSVASPAAASSTVSPGSNCGRWASAQPATMLATATAADQRAASRRRRTTSRSVAAPRPPMR